MNIRKTAALAMALLLAVLCPALGEEDPLIRTLYLIPLGEAEPCWAKVSPLLELPGIEDFSATGMIDGVRAAGKEASLYYSNALDQGQLEDLGLLLREGNTPSPGGCMVSQSFADREGLALGDSILLETEGRSASLEICGVYAPDPLAYPDPDLLSGFVLLSWTDFQPLMDPLEEGACTLDSVTLETSADLDAFIEGAREALDGVEVELYTMEQIVLLTQSPLGIPQGKTLVSAFEGTDLDGNDLPGEILEPGGVTMVNVWATYCTYCIQEMPDLKELGEAFAAEGRPFRIVGVCMDVTDGKGNLLEETLREGREIVAETGADYLQIIPSAKMAKEVGSLVNAFPTTFFLNDKREILSAYSGSRNQELWSILARLALSKV